MSTSSAPAHRYNRSETSRGSSGGQTVHEYLLSQILYGLGDWIYSLAIVILAYRLSGGLTAAAAVLLFQASGRLAGVQIASSLSSSDLSRQRRLAVGAGIVRATLIGTLLLVTSESHLWLAMIVAAAIGVLGPAEENSRRALAPHGMRPCRSGSLRSRFVCRWDQLAMVAGSVTGGLLIMLWSEHAALVVAASMSVAAVALLSRLPNPSKSPSPGAIAVEQSARPAVPRRLGTLQLLMLALAGGAALGIAIRVLLVEVVIGDHGSSELVYALFVALAGAGAFAGPISVPRLLGKLPSEIAIAGITGALTIALIATHVADRLPLVVPIVIGCGILAITGERAGETVVRRVVPDHQLDDALRQLALLIIGGQAIALALIASLHFLSGITLVLVCLTAASVLCASLPILMYVGKRTHSTAPGGD